MMTFCKNEKGSISVFVCILIPLFLVILGICIDGSFMMYYDAKLISATKFAAISATEFYDVVDGKAELKGTSDAGDSYDTACSVLKRNLYCASLDEFSINSEKKNECTVTASVRVKFFFARIFNIEGTTIQESYTAERILE